RELVVPVGVVGPIDGGRGVGEPGEGDVVVVGGADDGVTVESDRGDEGGAHIGEDGVVAGVGGGPGRASGYEPHGGDAEDLGDLPVGLHAGGSALLDLLDDGHR